jgi:hypothetical protein
MTAYFLAVRLIENFIYPFSPFPFFVPVTPYRFVNEAVSAKGA